MAAQDSLITLRLLSVLWFIGLLSLPIMVWSLKQEKVSTTWGWITRKKSPWFFHVWMTCVCIGTFAFMFVVSVRLLERYWSIEMLGPSPEIDHWCGVPGGALAGVNVLGAFLGSVGNLVSSLFRRPQACFPLSPRFRASI
jgi:hypothetical protein